MKKIKLLYIEDDADQRRHLTGELRQKSFQVAAVASGGKGLERLQKHRPDMVLCDLNMPNMSGLDVLRQIRKLDMPVPVIIITARGSVEQAVQAMKEGAFDFVLKPVEIHVLETTIRKALEHARLEDRLSESESHLQMLLETVPDVVYSLNAKGEFLSVSHSVEPLLGYRASEMLGKPVFDFLHPEDRPKVENGFMSAMKRNDAKTKTLQFRMITYTGQVVEFEVNRRLIYENGKPIRQDGIARDITDRKKLERELQLYSQELEKRVQERTERLEYSMGQVTALNIISNRFTQIYDEDHLMDEVPKLLTRALDFDRGMFILEQDGKLKLRSFSMEKDSPELIADFVARVSAEGYEPPPHFRQSLAENHTIFIPDLNADPRWPRERGEVIRTKALVIAPVRASQKPIGLLVGNMQHHERNLDMQDVERFEMFANMVGLALDNIRAYKSLERKVEERTRSLDQANRKLREKTGELEKKTYSLAKANVELLAIQEELESKNTETEDLLAQVSENHKRLEAILDASLSAIVMVDLNNKIIACNRRVHDFFSVDTEQMIGQPLEKLTLAISCCMQNQKRFDELVRYLEKRRDRGVESMNNVERLFERTFQLCSKPTRFVSIFAMPVLDKNDQELGSVWYFSDVTKIKQADEQLRTILEAAPIPFIVTRQKDGKILYANEPMAEIVGEGRDTLLGKLAPDYYVDPNAREVVIDVIRRTGHLRNHEVQIKRADGASIWMIFSISPTEIAGEPVFIGALYDINERKQTEEALRESEEKFRQLNENIKEAFWMVDLALNKIIYVSSSFEDIFGRPISGLYADPLDWLKAVHPDDLTPLRTRMGASRLRENEQEFRIIYKDDTVRWIRTRAFPIRNSKGETYRYCGVSEDITERKEAEKALQDSLKELAKTNQHLKETHAQLAQSEKMASLGMLVAGIAHEINTPIGAVHSMHDTMKRAIVKLKEALEEKYNEDYLVDRRLGGAIKVIQEASRVIENGSERVTTIVRRLKSFARLDEAELKTVDIHEGIEDTLTLIHHEIKHNITVIREFGDIPPVPCFPGRLNQVYLNLLINARQAITDQGEIRITTFADDNHIYIRISDNGQGIPRDKIGKVFDPGFTTKGVGVGTGLGLSICYQIVEDHKGRINVESEPGKGTTFIVAIPMNLDQLLQKGNYRNQNAI